MLKKPWPRDVWPWPQVPGLGTYGLGLEVPGLGTYGLGLGTYGLGLEVPGLHFGFKILVLTSSLLMS